MHSARHSRRPPSSPTVTLRMARPTHRYKVHRVHPARRARAQAVQMMGDRRPRLATVGADRVRFEKALGRRRPLAGQVALATAAVVAPLLVLGAARRAAAPVAPLRRKQRRAALPIDA